MQKILEFKNSLKGKGLKSLAEDSFWTMTSQIFIVLVNLATVYVLANLLSVNDYGQFKLITTWLGIAVGVGYTGYNYTLPQQISKNQKYNLYEVFQKTFLKSLPTFFGLFIISIYYLYNQNFNLGFGFFFGAFLAPILCVSTIVNLYYMGHRNFKMFALAQNFVDTIQLVAIALLAYFSSNFVFIISAYFIATIFANILIVLKSLYDDKKHKSSEKFLSKLSEVQDLVETVSDTKIRSKLNISAIIFGFVTQIDKLLIFHFIGAAPLAVYSIVTAISDQARTPSKAIAAAIFPRMSEKTFTKKKLYFIYFLLTLMCLFIFVILIILYPLIFKYVFPKYVDYIYLANIASIAILFAPVNLFYLYAQSKNSLESLNTYANLNTFLQLLLFPLATLTGSIALFIYAKLVMNVCSTLYIFVKVRKI
jgi:O-antigen/teichoic acid export membrane protein